MEDYLVSLERQVCGRMATQLLRVRHWRWDLCWARGLRTQDKRHAKLQTQYSRSRRSVVVPPNERRTEALRVVLSNIKY